MPLVLSVINVIITFYLGDNVIAVFAYLTGSGSVFAAF